MASSPSSSSTNASHTQSHELVTQAPLHTKRSPVAGDSWFLRFPMEIRECIYELMLPPGQLIRMNFTYAEQPLRNSQGKGHWLSSTSTPIPILLGVYQEARQFVLHRYDLSNIKYGKAHVWVSNTRDTFYFSHNDWEEFVLEHEHIRHYLPLDPGKIRDLVVGRAVYRVPKNWSIRSLDQWVLNSHIPVHELMLKVCPTLRECSLAISSHWPYELVESSGLYRDGVRYKGRQLYLDAFENAVDKMKEISTTTITANITSKLMLSESPPDGLKVKYFEGQVMDGIAVPILPPMASLYR